MGIIGYTSALLVVRTRVMIVQGHKTRMAHPMQPMPKATVCLVRREDGPHPTSPSHRLLEAETQKDSSQSLSSMMVLDF